MGSPDDSSNECCGNNQQTEFSFIFEEDQANDFVALSPVRSSHIAEEDDYNDDGDLSHCIQDSFNSSGCISQAFMSSKKTTSITRVTNEGLHLRRIQDCNDTKMSSLDLGNEDVEDLHYKRILGVILESSRSLVNEKPFCSGSPKPSSFVPWKKECLINQFAPLSPQRALKKLLFTVPLMIEKGPLAPPNKDLKESFPYKPWGGSKSTQHGFSENRRENDKYLALRSLVPSTNKVISPFPFMLKEGNKSKIPRLMSFILRKKQKLKKNAG